MVVFLAALFLLGCSGLAGVFPWWLWLDAIVRHEYQYVSMKGLLMGIGIFMDDAIVIAESIATELKRGLSPLKAAIVGSKGVTKGVLFSFATSIFLLGGLAFIQGNTGQALKVLLIVLFMVISASLLEAFLIFPHHLRHSLEHLHDRPRSRAGAFRRNFEKRFDHLRGSAGRLEEQPIQWRYPFLGIIVALFFLYARFPR